MLAQLVSVALTAPVKATDTKSVSSFHSSLVFMEPLPQPLTFLPPFGFLQSHLKILFLCFAVRTFLKVQRIRLLSHAMCSLQLGFSLVETMQTLISIGRRLTELLRRSGHMCCRCFFQLNLPVTFF